MKFFSILLKEGRKEELQKKYSSKFDWETLNWILNISDLVDFNHKYTDFVLKGMNPELSYGTEYVEEVIEYLKLFEKYQSQLVKKDINQYKDIVELESVLAPFVQNEKLKEEESKVDKIYEDDKFLIVKPKSEAASCKYGANTKWCVTSKGSGHFERYTSGRQQLYFIINKQNSSNKNYSKVAVHFDNSGVSRYWDSQDHPLDQKQVDLLEYAFPELIESIKQDYTKISKANLSLYLQEVFNSRGETVSIKNNYLGTKSKLSCTVGGFSTIDDMGFGHAEGVLTIKLNDEVVDNYNVFLTFKSSEYGKSVIVDYGFSGFDDDYELDLGLEDWSIDVTYIFDSDADKMAEGIRNHLATRTLDHIFRNPKLSEKVLGTTHVWQPNRLDYGYTFKRKDKGLIKHLVDWLDTGTIGTKLDFLVEIGKLKRKWVNNKPLYKHVNGGEWKPSSFYRGQMSSFFASAKHAGILNYRKIGSDFFLSKGPNFEAFKQGKLKAL